MILCFSGGLDSLAAYHFLEEPSTVYFACSEVADKEIFAIKKLAPNTIIDYSLNFRGKSLGINAYIPYRNLLFALRAADYSSSIVIAGIKDDNVPDKTPDAFSAMSLVMDMLGKTKIKVSSPFWEWTKEDIVKYLLMYDNGREIGISTSCYHPTKNFCGECPSCFRKACACWSFGIDLKFKNVTLAQVYLQRAREQQYSPERNESIIRYVTGNWMQVWK